MAYESGMQSAAVLEDKIFQALADPSRRAIRVATRRSRRDHGALRHLAAGGLATPRRVERRRSGARPARGALRHYRVEPRGMKPLIDWIEHYRAF